MSTEEWFDNRPCDRFPPKFRRSFLAFAVTAFPLAILGMFLAQVWVGGFRGWAAAAIFALSFGGGVTILATVAVLSIEIRQPVAVMFGHDALHVRTRRGRVYSRPYADFVRLEPLKMKSGRPPNECQCYLAELAARVPGTRGIWLTPENKARLEAKLGESRGGIPLYGRSRVP